ncbi:MAG: GDP-mannose 4,6-dehydratase, partial [Bacteroidales bacterium]|nr:GDP-mannose 4,6-dehydratase [Bacteroidales bacterium]
GVPNNLVPFITQTAIGKRECLNIFGNDYPTPDGTCQRDFIDIVDLARAHVFAVTRMIEGKMKKDVEIFNVGTGRPLSVMELVNAFEKVNGVKVNYRIAPRRPGDITAIWADPTKANTEMGWKATRTTEETLKAAWAWECHLAGK